MPDAVASLPAPPSSLIASDGTLVLGRWEARPSSLEVPAPGFAASLKHKAWTWFGLVGPDIIASALAADVGLVGQVFVFAADPVASRLILTDDRMSPLARGFAVAPPGQPTQAQGKGWHFRTQPSGDGREQVSVQAGRFALEMEVVRPHPSLWATWSGEGSPTGMVTCKQTALPVTGKLEVAGRTIQLGEQHRVLSDWSEGFPNRHTYWRWFIGAGRADGSEFGLNLALGNRDPRSSENALWWNGRLHGLSDCTIEPGDPEWRIRTADGALDLALAPAGERAASMNLLVGRNRYRQPAGRITGTITPPGKQPARVEQGWAFGEEHDVVW